MVGAPGTALQAELIPLHTSVPDRAHEPTPTVHTPPVGAHVPPQLDCPVAHTHVPDPLQMPALGGAQPVPNARFAVGMHVSAPPEHPCTPVWHAFGVHAVAGTLSTAPSQLSSIPLHVSVDGVPANTEQVVPIPAQISVPDRRHAPTPTEHAVPVTRQIPPQLVCPAGHTHEPAPSHTPPDTPVHAVPAGIFAVRAHASTLPMQ